jgi:hypothetical protein
VLILCLPFRAIPTKIEVAKGTYPMVEENFDDADGFRGFAGKTRSVLPALVLLCPSIISSGGADFVVEVTEVVGSVVAPYRGCPFDGH